MDGIIPAERGEPVMIRLLLVDDEPALLDIGKIFLEESGEFGIDIAGSATTAISMLTKARYDVVVSDYEMPAMDGIMFLKEVRRRHQDLPFILFTGRGREDVVIEALNSGADFYVQKGGDPVSQFADLTHKIRQAVEKKKTVEALQKAEERYRLITEGIFDGVTTGDLDGIITYASPSMTRITGYPTREIVGHPFLEFVAEEDRERLMGHFIHTLRGGTVEGLQIALCRKDGETIHVEMNGCTLFHEGEVVGAQSVMRDITGQKKAEMSLQEEKERIECVIEGAGLAIWDWSLETGEVYFNGYYLEMLGYAPGDAPFGDLEWILLVHPDDRTEMVRSMKEHLEGKTPYYSCEFRLRGKDNSWIRVRSAGRVVAEDSAGRPLRVSGVHQEIRKPNTISTSSDDVSRTGVTLSRPRE